MNDLHDNDINEKYSKIIDKHINTNLAPTMFKHYDIKWLQFGWILSALLAVGICYSNIHALIQDPNAELGSYIVYVMTMLTIFFLIYFGVNRILWSIKQNSIDKLFKSTNFSALYKDIFLETNKNYSFEINEICIPNTSTGLYTEWKFPYFKIFVNGTPTIFLIARYDTKYNVFKNDSFAKVLTDKFEKLNGVCIAPKEGKSEVETESVIFNKKYSVTKNGVNDLTVFEMLSPNVIDGLNQLNDDRRLSFVKFDDSNLTISIHKRIKDKEGYYPLAQFKKYKTLKDFRIGIATEIIEDLDKTEDLAKFIKLFLK